MIVGCLSARVALVTGSTSGIGAAVARRLTEHGAGVMLNSARSVEAGHELAAQLGADVEYHRADISSEDECRALVKAAQRRFDRLDILVNNAAWTSRVEHDDLDGLTNEIFRRTLEVNVLGTWWMTRAAMPLLRESPDGNVTTVTSLAGVRPRGSSIAYAMTKAALDHFTRLMAKSHGPVRFNSVAPGPVDTPWTAEWGTFLAHAASASPIRRVTTADEQADAILACITNTSITGASLVVDAGLSLVS